MPKLWRKATILLLLAGLLLAALACGQSTTTVTQTATATVTQTATQTVTATATVTSTPPAPVTTVTDDLGRKVNIKGIPQRVVSLAPSNTELLFALGQGDKVVGVTDFCDYPPEATQKPKVGTVFPGFNAEVIVNLKPDLVFAIGTKVPDIVTQLEAKGIPGVVLQPATLEDIYKDIRLVGQIMGVTPLADYTVARLQEEAQTVVQAVSLSSYRPTVFYGVDVSDPAQLWTAGKDTFPNTFIEMAGGINIARDKVTGYSPPLSLEALVAADPDIIILGGASWGVSATEVASRPVWNQLKAVKEGHIYAIDDTPISRPGPRIIQGFKELVKLIQPQMKW